MKTFTYFIPLTLSMFRILLLQKKKVLFFRKNLVLSHGEINFNWSWKMQVLQFVIQVTRVKTSENFAVIMMRKIKFLKTLHKKEIFQKETYEIGLWLHTQWLFFFKNLPICLCLYKNNAPKKLYSWSTELWSNLPVKFVFFVKMLTF